MTPGTNGLPEPILWLPWLEIAGKIGEGNCSMVYRAYDPLTGERFALKEFTETGPYPDKERNEKRFRLEIACHCRLHHPHIVQAFGHGQVEDGWFLVLSLVKGKTLDELIGDRSLSLKEELVIGVQIVQALAYMHDQQVIHRDLKPHNIIVADGNAFLFDFGLALQDGEPDTLTQCGMTVGTPNYMAPEQALAEDWDSRTDIYGFGATLYHLFTGHQVFDGKSAAIVMMQQIDGSPADPREYNSAIPAGVAALILKALEKEPDRRFQTAAEMAAAIQKELEKLRA